MALPATEQEHTPGLRRETFTAASISRPPSTWDVVLDRLFRGLTLVFAALTIVLVLYIVMEIGGKAAPAMQQYGLGFMTSTTWDVNKGRFGVLPEIWGTLYSSVLALLLGGFFGISIAIFLTQDFLPPKLVVIFKNIVELLAAIPSVVYGLWGIFVLIPAIRPMTDWLHQNFSCIPLFRTSLSGPVMLPAPLVLGFGRALGETMALAMLVGNSNQLSISLFSPATTLAALLALNFPEADNRQVQVLMYAAVLLLAITLLVNICGGAVLRRATAHLSTGRR